MADEPDIQLKGDNRAYLINNCDQVIRQNKQTTVTRSEIRLLMANSSQRQKKRNTMPLLLLAGETIPPLHLCILWCGLIHRVFWGTREFVENRRTSKHLIFEPPSHVAGVALEKTEQAGIEHKDDGDEARKAVMNVVKERIIKKCRFVTHFEAASLSKQQRRVRSEPLPYEDIAILVRDLMEAEKQSAQKHVKGVHLKQLMELRALSTDEDKKATFTASIKTAIASFVSYSKTSYTSFASKPLSSTVVPRRICCVFETCWRGPHDRMHIAGGSMRKALHRQSTLSKCG